MSRRQNRRLACFLKRVLNGPKKKLRINPVRRPRANRPDAGWKNANFFRTVADVGA